MCPVLGSELGISHSSKISPHKYYIKHICPADSAASRRRRLLADQMRLRRKQQEQKEQAKTPAPAEDDDELRRSAEAVRASAIVDAALEAGETDGDAILRMIDSGKARVNPADDQGNRKAGQPAVSTGTAAAVHRTAAKSIHRSVRVQKEAPPVGNADADSNHHQKEHPLVTLTSAAVYLWRSISSSFRGEPSRRSRRATAEAAVSSGEKKKIEDWRDDNDNVDVGLLSLSSSAASDSTEGQHGHHGRELSSHCPNDGTWVDCYYGIVRSTFNNFAGTPCYHQTATGACNGQCCTGSSTACSRTTACIKKDGSCDGDGACAGVVKFGSVHLQISGPSCVGRGACEDMFNGNSNTGLVRLTRSCLCEFSCSEDFPPSPEKGHCEGSSPSPLPGLPACGESFCNVVGRSVFRYGKLYNYGSCQSPSTDSCEVSLCLAILDSTCLIGTDG